MCTFRYQIIFLHWNVGHPLAVMFAICMDFNEADVSDI